MKLSRLLTVLTLIVAGLSGPAPAAAQTPFQPNVNVGNIPGICAAFSGTLVRDPAQISCQAGDDLISCGAELCAYQPTRSGLLEDPPFKDTCEQARGTFLGDLRYLTCTLREGMLALQCPDWWEWGTTCDLGWTPSEQPME